MFSDNIIVRDQALADLVSLNWTNTYFLMVIALLIISWRLSKWL